MLLPGSVGLDGRSCIDVGVASRQQPTLVSDAPMSGTLAGSGTVTPTPPK